MKDESRRERAGMSREREKRSGGGGGGRVLPPYHLNGLRVERLDEDSFAGGHVLHQLVERRSLDLFPVQVGHAVQEVKGHAALLQLLAEEVMEFSGGGVCGPVKERKKKKQEHGYRPFSRDITCITNFLMFFFILPYFEHASVEKM